MVGKISSVGYAVVVMVMLWAPLSPAQAAMCAIDDFEDGNHDGWLLNEGGGGANGVEYVNESNWAYVYTNKSGVRSLSQEFPYEPGSILSFDMHTLANTGSGNYGETTHAASGVTVTFENNFNIALGSVSFVYATSSSLLPANSYQIANTADSYSGLMSEWAALANVGSSSSIADVDLKFWARGHTAQIPRGSAATARVRFDNVVVPEPASMGLLALGGVALIRRRRTA